MPRKSRQEKVEKLIAEVAFSEILVSEDSVKTISPSFSDVKLMEYEQKLVEALASDQAVARLRWTQAPFAPLLRLGTKKLADDLLRPYKQEVHQASVHRKGAQARYRLDCDRGGVLSQKVESLTWPFNSSGKPVSALEAVGTTSFYPRFIPPMTPDQFRAIGLIELVRASGKFRRPGGKTGDELADIFCALVIGFSGSPLTKAGYRLALPDSWLQIDFSNMCRGLEVTDEAKESLEVMKDLLYENGSLKGGYVYLAVTILAAWLRMSRLGVRLSSRERLSQWSKFFDGVNYGDNTRLIGEAWRMSTKDAEETAKRFNLSPPWREMDLGSPPWLTPKGGVPLIFYGLAMDSLLSAVQGFSSPLPDSDSNEIQEVRENSFDILEVQLLQHYRAMAGTVEGSARGLRLVDTF